MKKFRKVLVQIVCVLLVLLAVVLMGCNSLLDHVTPAYPDAMGADYVTGPVIPGDIPYASADYLKANPVMPYTTLADVKKQRRFIDYKHEDVQTVYKDAIRDDKVVYGRNVDSTDRTIADSQSIQDNFNEGFNGIGGPALMGMTGIGILAWSRRKPGDVSKEQAQQDKDKALNDLNVELGNQMETHKESLNETVAGIDRFIKSYRSGDGPVTPPVIAELKKYLQMAQSPKTQELVAVAKVK